MTVVAATKPFGVNVLDAGLVGDGVTDNRAALQALVNGVGPNGGMKLWVPAGMYQLSGKVDLSPLQYFTMEGEYVQGGSTRGSCFRGSSAGTDAMLHFDGDGMVSMRNISVSYAGNGTAVRMARVKTSSFEGCRFNAFSYQGMTPKSALNLYGGNSSAVRNCQFMGDGTVVGLMCASGAGVLVDSCDFMGLSEGIRCAGTGFSVQASQFQVCKYGLRLGATEDGNNWGLSRSFFHGLTFEANDYDIFCQVAAGCHFAGIGMQGSPGSPSHGSKYGIYMQTCQDSVFSAIKVGGSYVNAGIGIRAAPNENTRLCFDAVQTPSWQIPALGGQYGNLNFRACNQPAGL